MTGADGSTFPMTRLRRLRAQAWIRRTVRQAHLAPEHLIWALIVHEGPGVEAVDALPGVNRLDASAVADTARQAKALGISALALFPNIAAHKKDAIGREADNQDGLIPRMIAQIKSAVPDMGVICDVALDPYTSHGHDGVMDESGRVLNDPTIERLVEQGLMLAEAGADVLAPSDMMDGRVGALRQALEAQGYDETLILSYAAKYASNLYGPFREAVGSAGVLTGDKQTYQMDPANSDEAMREIALDIAEGADMVMVKPGLPYLDVIARASQRFEVPVLAFQVSGEYAQIQAASDRSFIDGDAVMLESLLAFRRAGARAIITYFAGRAAQILAG